MGTFHSDREALDEIKGTAGYRVIESLVQKKILELVDVRNVDNNQDVASQTLGRQLVVSLLQDLLNTLNIVIPPPVTRKTHE